MNKKLLLFLKIFLSGVILFFLFYKIPLKETSNALLTADFFLILLSLIIYLFCHYLSALETNYLTRVQGINISTQKVLKIHFASMFYNLFLPGYISGGAVKWYKFSKYGSKSDAAAIVAFNRFLETFMTVLTGIVYSIPAIMKREETDLFIITVILLVLLILIYFVFLNKKFLSVLKKIFTTLPLSEFIKNGFEKVINSFERFRNLTTKENLQIFLLLFTYHSLGILIAYLLALSLNIMITFFDIAWIRAAISILTMLPISFAGLGVREVSLVFFLGKYGVKPDTSMAYSLLIFFNITVASLFGGLIEFLDFVSNKKKITNSSIKQ